ncbi:hypothetical protein LTR20_003940 [Exophiala xenobiotica]|nr:hypothetical protein LTS13_005598 [Exophiala xenobiotica]KAK5402079.1 hypothetical protein LTR79_000806 [Exophiala xenobiotica]KAK5419501.1 hypothetical protein LTR90_004565 [Exophiala xenobiotica]KAK5466992.1 hypothetical protein LTR20_003940 [Exophiala xenobiotica]KAK5487886.1 hypothetical protein LTR83_007521 [Exophiala xenobiotica]
MIRALFAVASTIHHLQHRTAFLAVPNFVIESTYAVSLIDPLLSGAGLHGFQSRRRDESRAALIGLYQLQHCYGIHVNETHQIPDIECEKYNGRLIHSFLSIQLDASYFGLHQMYRNDGLIAISENMTEDYFDRGTNSLNAQDPDHYWSWVKDRVSHFSRHGAEPIDLLILHGTGVTRPNFLQLVREVFAHNDKIKAEEYLRTAEEHAYAASKGAAQIAKTDMAALSANTLRRNFNGAKQSRSREKSAEKNFELRSCSHCFTPDTTCEGVTGTVVLGISWGDLAHE